MVDKTADNGMGSWQPAQGTGNWGIGKAAPQGQGGVPVSDPWKDKANDGFRPFTREEMTDVPELMSSEPIVEMDTIRPSNSRQLIIRPDSPKQIHALYDPVRDVTPATKGAPAPDEGPVGDPWTDLGDNGIGSSINLNDPKIRKFIEHMQMTFPDAGFFPGVTDINKVGQERGKLESLREPNDLDRHLVLNHNVEENITVYPLELVEQLHMSFHAQGQASDHNPEALRVANILDPIQETLDPKIWDNATTDEPKIKSTITAWIKAAIFGTLKNAGYKNPEQWIDLIVTGSLTTYQWSEASDLDVSIWVDLNEFPDFQRSEMIKVIINNLDGDLVPGTLHPIQCFVVDVNEIHSPQEIYKAGVRSAYNLDTDEWIVKPERERSKNVPTQFPDFFRKAKQASAKMELLLKYQPKAAETYWHFLHKRRRDDMRAGLGDYSESNIIYKMLANDGLFDDIARITGEHIAATQSSLLQKIRENPIVDAFEYSPGGKGYWAEHEIYFKPGWTYDGLHGAWNIASLQEAWNMLRRIERCDCDNPEFNCKNVQPSDDELNFYNSMQSPKEQTKNRRSDLEKFKTQQNIRERKRLHLDGDHSKCLATDYCPVAKDRAEKRNKVKKRWRQLDEAAE